MERATAKTNRQLAEFRDQLRGLHVIFHKAEYDLPLVADLLGLTLEELLDHIAGFDDTMQMLYVLRYTTGLKPAERRYNGRDRDSFMDIMREPIERVSREWLESLILNPKYICATCDGIGLIIDRPRGKTGALLAPRPIKCADCEGDGTIFPPPDERLEFKNGQAHIARGLKIGTRIQKAIRKPPEKGLNHWWHKQVDDDYRAKIEVLTGPMPEATLDDVVPQSKAVNYSGADADGTLRLEPKLRQMLEANGQMGIYEINRDALPLITRMMDVGVRVDVDRLRTISDSLENDCDKIAYKLERLVGRYLNPGSRDQVADLLFGEWKLPVVEWTETDQESTKDKVLEDLKLQVAAWPTSKKQAKTLAGLGYITDHRERSKLKSMCRNLIMMVDRDGRIHCSINSATTGTNRYSSSDPNLQNIPNRTELGRQLRSAFIAPDGYELVDLDYGQIEVRVMAHASEDANLIRILHEGVDVHLGTAALVFQKARETIQKWERQAAKSLTFLIIYGGQAERLRAELKLSGIDVDVETAQKFIDAYLEDAYPGIRDFMWEQQAFARRRGYVQDMFGWRRYLPGVHSEIRSVKREAERMAVNAPIQSGAAGIMKKSCPAIYEKIKLVRKRGYDCDPLLTVHDEFLFQVKKGGAQMLMDEVREAMTSQVTLKVPVVADGKIGERWNEAH